MRRRARKSFVATLAAAATASALGTTGQADAAVLEPLVRASLGQQETESNAGIIDRPSISADGRYVAFASEADNLVGDDKAQWIDIFIRDELTRTTKRINTALSGGEADGASFAPQISADGRYVVYDSYATNLTSGDTNGLSDVFMYDTVTDTTRRVSATADGKAADGDSANASISADGRYVAFDSTADNLVAEDTNGKSDVFIWDRTTGKSIRASVGTTRNSVPPQANGSSGLPSVSADGTRVAFVSAASNLARGDINGAKDVYVRDLRAGRTFLASLGGDSQLGNMDANSPALSAEGNHVAFETPSRLSEQDHDRSIDVYLRDLTSGTTTLVSAPVKAHTKKLVQRGISYGASISGDGRYVSFTSFANDLVHGDRDLFQEVFLRDTLTGAINRAAVNLHGVPASAASFGSVLNAAGTQLAFNSEAANLVKDDTNEVVDAFVRAVPSSLPASAPTPPGGPRSTL